MTAWEDKPRILLQLLGPDVADSVLEQLPRAHADKLRSELEQRSSASPSSDQQAVLQEFERLFRVFGKRKPTHLSVVSPYDEHHSGRSAAGGEPFVPSGDPVADCARMPLHKMAAALTHEQPRTIAMLLQVLPPERAAEILSLFPEELRPKAVIELSRVSAQNQSLIERIAEATVRRAATLSADDGRQVDRIRQLADVLRSVEKPLRARMLEAFNEQDEETAEQVLAHLYRFEDLLNADDRVIQQVLGEVDSTTLATSLFQADSALVDKILSNLSKRAGLTLKEELEFQSHVPTAVLQHSRTSVAKILAKVDQEADD